MNIAAILDRLGIPQNYAERRQLYLQQDCPQPVSIGLDVFDRQQTMLAAAASAWFDMQSAANSDGIKLQAVSAYRPVAYQTGIIERKLNAGQCIEDILKVSAAPGYSEHHSGRALDITCPGYKPLEEEFENSPAFAWLTENAQLFEFKLSYPRNNLHGLAYEPWHWCWHSSN